MHSANICKHLRSTLPGDKVANKTKTPATTPHPTRGGRGWGRRHCSPHPQHSRNRGLCQEKGIPAAILQPVLTAPPSPAVRPDDFCGSQALLPSWDPSSIKKNKLKIIYYSYVGVKNIIQAGYIVTYLLLLYSFFSSDFKRNENISMDSQSM